MLQTLLGVAIAFAAIAFGGQYILPIRQRSGPVIDLGYSIYEGSSLDNGQNQFLGIRFAAPPLGDKRFRRPYPPSNTTGIQSAKAFGSVCYALGEGLVEGHSEDCLFLNIWTPSDASSESKLPVFVWIQGGGYNTNSHANYNGSGLIQSAENKMVFVALNYRVGPYGFLASERIRRDGDLNVGLLDQRFALEWVQKYITKFGGDPTHVVLVGASAGAGSIAMHMIAHGGKPTNLFHGVFGISPFFPGTMKVHEREWQFELFSSLTDCNKDGEDPVECLRSKDSETLQKANVEMTFPGRKGEAMFTYPPVVDGDFLQDHPQALFMQDKFVKVPAIFGVDTDEGTMFTPNITSFEEMADFFLNNFHVMREEHISQIKDLYPIREENPFPNKSIYFPSAAAALGDVYFVCPALMLSNGLSRHARTWNYRYNVLTPADYLAGLGVSHTSEVHNVFGLGNSDMPVEEFNQPDIPFIPILQAYYTSFVRFLDPNAKSVQGSVRWPGFHAETLQRLVLQSGKSVIESVSDEQLNRCELWWKLSSELQQ